MDEGRGGWVRPTFRPDSVVNLDTPSWSVHVERLAQAAGTDVVDYRSFVRALETAAFFKAAGAVATDHSAVTPTRNAWTAARRARSSPAR